AESLVLLKNNGALPLDKKKINTIAVIGPNADSRLSLIGNYHGTSSRYITVLNGIQDYCADDVRVLYSEGCHLFKDAVESLSQPGCVDRLAEAAAVSDLADAIIVVLGLDETLEGEEGDTGNADASGDKLDLYLPESQRTLLDTIVDRFRGVKPIIVINMTGSCVDLVQAHEGADAILQAWYPGARGGRVIADVLFGEISPSGKLPVTFYDSSYELPDITDYSMKRRTYRYLDGDVLYPFGYGLTYGNCSVRAIESVEENGSSRDHILRVKVANDSSIQTEDVLQIYVQAGDCPDACPHPVLGAFCRISLGAHAEEVITIPLPYAALSTVDENGERSVSVSRFTLYAGFSQPDKRSAVLTDHPCASFELTL
ncbi:MAG: glycoside hydrolase family 3 C-terminal domain-containing protein, partial [Lachnospiraceae bacterium]|nr:glycoside hydrolase family 3 C-terminal domain-containing protein [Lachnospiraceae bacterium]